LNHCIVASLAATQYLLVASENLVTFEALQATRVMKANMKHYCLHSNNLFNHGADVDGMQHCSM
jgi:hypothetical protein